MVSGMFRFLRPAAVLILSVLQVAPAKANIIYMNAGEAAARAAGHTIQDEIRATRLGYIVGISSNDINLSLRLQAISRKDFIDHSKGTADAELVGKLYDQALPYGPAILGAFRTGAVRLTDETIYRLEANMQAVEATHKAVEDSGEMDFSWLNRQDVSLTKPEEILAYKTIRFYGDLDNNGMSRMCPAPGMRQLTNLDAARDQFNQNVLRNSGLPPSQQPALSNVEGFDKFAAIVCQTVALTGLIGLNGADHSATAGAQLDQDEKDMMRAETDALRNLQKPATVGSGSVPAPP